MCEVLDIVGGHCGATGAQVLVEVPYDLGEFGRGAALAPVVRRLLGRDVDELDGTTQRVDLMARPAPSLPGRVLQPKGASRVKRFGNLETTVMERIWRLGRPVVVREIFEELKAEREIVYTTVMTTMDSLYRKGWLRREPRGRAYAYEAVASREAYAARLMIDALATSDNQAAAFVYFLEQLSESEARALRTALEISPSTKRAATDPGPR